MVKILLKIWSLTGRKESRGGRPRYFFPFLYLVYNAVTRLINEEKTSTPCLLSCKNSSNLSKFSHEHTHTGPYQKAGKKSDLPNGEGKKTKAEKPKQVNKLDPNRPKKAVNDNNR